MIRNFQFIFILLFVNAKIFVRSSENNLCSEEFCERYLEKNECLSATAACHVQNSTFNGEEYSSIVPCNCCKTCIENIGEGNFCSIGSPDFPPPSSACGPGLYCTKDKNGKDHKCRKMEHTPCFKQQIEFDNLKENQKGAYVQRPNCDGDGNYKAAKCNIGQTCFCVNEEGQRIFGESIYSPNIEMTMKCECSRLYDKFIRLQILSGTFKYPVPTFRCLEDGSFDPMQCLNDECLCVERDTGFPVVKYNISEVEYSDFSCYNKIIHRSYTYLHDCERIQRNLLDEIRQAENSGAIAFDIDIPYCQSDGWFPAVQEDKNTKYCVDRYGRKIDEYSVPKDSVEAKNMNCKCARTQHMLRINKIPYQPKCTANGNFLKVQCRNKMCYCVDDDGIQISKEMPESKDAIYAC